MSNYEYPIDENAELKILAEKDKCTHEECFHSAFKCHKCGKWKDNLQNEQIAQIEVLQAIVAVYDELLYYHSIPHITYKRLIDDGIIEVWLKDRTRRIFCKNDTALRGRNGLS